MPRRVTELVVIAYNNLLPAQFFPSLHLVVPETDWGNLAVYVPPDVIDANNALRHNSLKLWAVVAVTYGKYRSARRRFPRLRRGV